MTSELTPVLRVAIAFAYVGGFAFVAAGVFLTVRRRRLHPLLLVCISAISFSWLEAPYDWAVYAQFPSAIPRMPSWWPLNMTWGGLPAPVPAGYIAYFVLPAVIGAALGRRRRAWTAAVAPVKIALTILTWWAGATRSERANVGVVIMAGTLLGLIVLVFALVLRYDPEARRPTDGGGQG